MKGWAREPAPKWGAAGRPESIEKLKAGDPHFVCQYPECWLIIYPVSHSIRSERVHCGIAGTQCQETSQAASRIFCYNNSNQKSLLQRTGATFIKNHS